MPNDYFQFKSFIIKQDKCAMKVCTDACLFGAWVASKIKDDKSQTILDIGAGTGLLSLMLAQETSALIHSVEVDNAAAQQADENFMASPWSTKLEIHNCSIQEFSRSSTGLYNIIISNPPFFEGSLKSDDQQKNLAKHTSSLTYLTLAKVVGDYLQKDGKFFILLPHAMFKNFTEQATEQGLFLAQQVNVQQTYSHSFFRTMGVFTKKKIKVIETGVLSIKTLQNEYSAEFTQLLKDYYLYL